MIPTIDDTGNMGAVINENAAVGNADPVVGEVNFGADLITSRFIPVSDKMLRLSNAANLETELNRAVGERIGRTANQRFTTGTDGIMTRTTKTYTVTTEVDELPIRADDIYELIYSVPRYYRGPGRPGVGFQMRDSTVKTLRQIKNGNGDYMFSNSGNLVGGEPDRLDVYPLWVNEHIEAIPTAASENEDVMLFGDMRSYAMRVAGRVNMVRSRERFINILQAGFMGFVYAQGKMVDANAFAKLNAARIADSG